MRWSWTSKKIIIYSISSKIICKILMGKTLIQWKLTKNMREQYAHMYLCDTVLNQVCP